MIMKLLAALGIIFIFVCVSLLFAAVMTGLEDDTSPEDDDEQMQYIMRWYKDHEKR